MSEELTWYGRKIYTPADMAEMQRKVRLAKEARELGKALHAGKPLGFRKVDGH